MSCLSLAFQGCGLWQRGQEPVEIAWPEEEDGEEAQEETIGFQALIPDLPEEAETVYLEAEKAKACPEIEVAIAGGDSKTIQPGREGYVTLVVFWRIVPTKSRAAARHAADLYREFRERGLRVIGVVEKTRAGYRGVDQFVRAQAIEYPIYYDDFEALRKMSKSVDARVKTAVPSFFLIDRAGRLRLYRSGSSFWVRRKDFHRVGQEELFESAPQDEAVSDYVERLLQETY